MPADIADRDYLSIVISTSLKILWGNKGKNINC